MWFGPKGFASVVYGLLVLNSGIPAADESANLVGFGSVAVWTRSGPRA
jgi:sodium/hydrogen antiporter